MKEQTGTWDDLRKWVVSYEPTDPNGLPRRVYWRGQRDPSWGLVSAFDRMAAARLKKAQEHNREVSNLKALRQKIWGDFKERLIGASGVRQADLRDQPQYTWATGRHFGLMTPLLDWSESPYIALFFALRDLCDQRRSAHGVVQIRASDAVALFRLVEGPGVAGEGLKFERARFDGLPRLIAQKGAFTIMEGDFEHTCIAEHLKAHEKGDALEKFVLAGGGEVASALKELRASGIDYRTLFPDEEGAALAANELAETILVAPAPVADEAVSATLSPNPQPLTQS